MSTSNADATDTTEINATEINATKWNRHSRIADFRLASQAKNIHTAAMVSLLLIGMLAAEVSATKAD